jgi:hypothetical protein
MFDINIVKLSQYLLNLGLSLESMKRISTNYVTVYLSNGGIALAHPLPQGIQFLLQRYR